MLEPNFTVFEFQSMRVVEKEVVFAGVKINFFNNLPVGQVIANVYMPETKRHSTF